MASLVCHCTVGVLGLFWAALRCVNLQPGMNSTFVKPVYYITHLLGILTATSVSITVETIKEIGSSIPGP